MLIVFSIIPSRERMRNLALSKQLTDELCLFLLTDMTYVTGQFFLTFTSSHMRPFSKMTAQKACENDIF